MKLVFISDTHNKMSELVDGNFIQDGDVFIHCGDATGIGSVDQLASFNGQVSKLPHQTKIFIPGNHDILFERNQGLARQILSAFDYILIDEAVEINGVKFYGSPWTPTFHNWAFNKDRGLPIKKVWGRIPDDVEVLLVHGPPHGILDTAMPGEPSLGCEELRARVDELKDLKVCAFGHIHGGRGSLVKGKKTFLNASAMTESYELKNPSLQIHLKNQE